MQNLVEICLDCRCTAVAQWVILFAQKMHSVLRAPSATGAAAASHGTNRLRSCVLEARAAALAGALLACAVVRVSECERASASANL